MGGRGPAQPQGAAVGPHGKAFELARRDPSKGALVDSVRALRGKVVAYDLGSHDERTIARARQRHQRLSRQRNVAEEALLSSVDPFLPPTRVADVLQSLPPDSVFVDLTILEPPDHASRTHYAAVLLAPSAQPRLVVIGPVQQIDQTARELVNTVSAQPGPADDGAALLERAERIKRLAGDLSAWSTATDLPRHIIVSPVGIWARLPLALLQDSGGMPLVERHIVHTVPSARWWVNYRKRIGDPRPQTAAPVVVGDVDFDHGLTEQLDHVDFLLRMRVDRLDHSASEARKVADRLGTEPVTGPHADRVWLLGLARPDILHLATHGLFVTALGSTAEQRESGLTRLRSIAG